MESELGRIVDSLPGLVWTAFPDGQIEYLNQRWSEYTGLGVDECRGRGWQAAVHAEDLPRLLAGWRPDSASNAPVEAQVRLRGPHGKYRWFLFRAHPCVDASGRVVKWSGMGSDIDEQVHAEEALREDRKKAEALLAGEKRLLEMGASGRPMSDVLEALCRFVESTVSGSYCSIVLLDPGGGKLREAIAPSLPAEFNDAVRGWPLDRVGGPCVMAARENTQVIMSDVASDTRWRNGWRALAQAHGLRSCWSTPILSQAGKVLGTFALYQREAGSPSPLQLERIERFTHIASIAIERARREVELRQSEARRAAAERDLHSMIDTIPVFIAAYEPDGTRSFVNRTWQDYMGLTLEEATGPAARIFPHFHPDDSEMNDKAWRASRATGEPLSIEVRVRRADGQYRWHTSQRVPLRDENGNIIRWYSVGIDIEDRKAAEEALRRSEARRAEAERELQLTIDTLPILVATYRPDSSRIFVNQTWRDYTGLSLENAERSSIVHPDEAERFAQEWHTSLAAGAPLNTEARLRRADGEYRWHAIHRVLARDEAGAIARLYNVAVDIEDRKAAEEALRRSEARRAEAERELRLMIDSIPTLVATYRPDGSRIFVNRTWRDYTGLALETASEAERIGFIHPDDAAHVAGQWQKSLATGDPFQAEMRLRRADGEYRWYLVHRIAARDESGAIVKWYSVAADIEERKRAEETLRESERDSRLIVDSIPGLVATFTPDGEFEFVNGQIVEYFGRTLEDLKAKRWGPRDGLHPDDLARVTEAFKQSMASGDPFDFEVRALRFDGVYRWFQSRGSPLRDTNGRIVRWYNLLIDIEERKLAEEALRQSEARLSEAERELRLTLDTIPGIVWRGAANGYVQHLNKRWYEYTGTTPEQTRGRRWKSWVHPDDLEPLVDAGIKYVVAGIPVDTEARLRRFDGEYRWFLFRPAPARDETGQIVGWYGTIIDIEDRKRAEQKAIEVERELQQTIDNIPVWVGTYSADGTRLSVNKRVVELSGVPAKDLSSEHWFHPEELEAIESQWRACVASGTPLEREVRTRMADGSYRWHLTRRVPLRDETGKIIRWYGVGYDIEDRKRAEQKAIEAERELQHMIDHIPAMVSTYRADGTRVSINKRGREVTGIPAEGLPADEPWAHPDEFDSISAQWRACIARGEPFEREFRIRMADGSYRWHWVLRVPAPDTTGKVIRWYGVGYDIEDQKRAEQALATSERNLKLIIDTVPAQAWSARRDGSAEFLNQQYLDYVGLPAEQILDWGWTAAVHPDDLNGLLARWQNVLASATPGEAEARLRRHDGEYRWFLFRATPLRDDNGNIVKWYGFNLDIEDRRRAEEKLRRSEAFLAKAQQLSLTGSFSLHSATRKFTWSEELYRIFGFQPGVPITFKMLGTRNHPEDRELIQEMAERRRAGATDFDYEHRLLMPDGSIKYIRVVAHGASDKEGRGLEYFGAVQDVTQRRLAEAALDKARSELAHVTRVMSLGALTASIAHEVNQPLAGIITNASTCLRMLSADPPNIKGAQETARRTIRDGNRAADVITRLRALFGKRTSATETVDLNETAREVLSLVFTDLLRNRVVLRTDFDDNRPLLVTGDRIQLQQVILNLVRNASEAMSEVNDRPRHLLVRLEEEDGAARLTVRDSGIGLEPQSIERLFDAFYTTKSDGMGIGLSVSRSIIESHGGRLWADANDGPGATFSFSLPRLADGATAERTGDTGWTPNMSSERDVMRTT